MNKYLKHIIFTFGLVLSFSIAFAQAPLESIRSSFGAGNVGGISRHFDKAVSLSITGSQDTYSRSQAEMVLRDFFNKNAPKAMNIEHNGENNSGSYAIGTLVTSNGNYRAYFALRHKESGYFIQEIRIER